MLSVTYQQILQNPHNDSTAKYLWSFSKSKRFKKYSTNCPVTCYQIPTTKSKRSTSFGIGTRSKIQLSTVSPSPYFYNTQSQFENNKRKGKGTSFGKNRQECKSQGYMSMGLLKNPGPGEYTPQKSKTIQYSMRPKTSYPRQYFLTNYQKKLTPGPGTYQQPLTLINPKGTIISRSKNPHRTILKFTAARFNRQKQTPGPAHYQDHNIMKTGDYILSTNQSTGSRVFSHQKRQLKLQGNRDTPGPGSYKRPSDFGQYQKKFSTLEEKKYLRRSVTLQN